MAGFASDSGSEYAYDLTTSDEEVLWAIVDRLSTVSPHQSRPVPTSRPTPASPTTNLSTPARRTTTAISSSPFTPSFDPDATQAIEETIAAITDEDLSFDLSELNENDDYGHTQGAAPVHNDASRSGSPGWPNRGLLPSVAETDRSLASFVAKTKPRSMPTLLPGQDVCYPDLSRALADTEDPSRFFEKAQEGPTESSKDKLSPLLRFRTFPMKTLSVSDLTAGSWCELQHFYTLTRLPGGRKTRTAAMKRGTKLHEKLEREVFTPVQVDVTKREDTFGLKIWNMIQGLRVLRDQGATREFEVWGMVDGYVVNGVIDGLSYENPDEELQDDVFSSRGSSQTITNSQPYEPSTPGDSEIFITDVKTRNSALPPRQEQVRVSIIQLFLYHRFLSDMAADRLDYMAIFERYGLNPDEPFSDSFMAQIGAVHDEVFAEAGADTDSVSTLDNTDGDSNSEFVSAPCSPSQLSFTSSTGPNLQYRTLRTLLPLLKRELRLTFPRGAADLGKIVAVEYRYRGRDEATPPPPPTTTTTTLTDPAPLTTYLALDPDETDPFQPTSLAPRRQEPERGSVICTNTFFVEPETLDLFLSETMRWWKGERPPQGVPREEAGFKCRSCEFREDCEWRKEMDLQALGRATRRKKGAGAVSAGFASNDAGVSGFGPGGVDVDADADVEREGEGKRRRGRPRKGDKEREREVDDIEDGGGIVGREGVKRGRGRPKKVPAVDASVSAAAAAGG